MPVCWSCSQPAGDDAFCANCGVIQPARPKDHFAVLGIERRFRLDETELEKRYRDLSRKLHPDKFARAPARERRFSLEQSTRLNEAYKTLRDRVKRAEYILTLEGFELASEEGSEASRKLPPEFFEEVMEDREALAEAKEADAADGGSRVSELATRIENRRRESIESVERAFASWEDGAGQEALAPAVTELAKLRYYARFLDEVEGREHF